SAEHCSVWSAASAATTRRRPRTVLLHAGSWSPSRWRVWSWRWSPPRFPGAGRRAPTSRKFCTRNEMRAVVFDRYGPPDVLRLEDVERPVPKDDEVLVKVHATTVNRLDCATREANRRSGLALSFMSRLVFGLRLPKQPVLGTEFAGEVEAVGAAVREFAVGDRVFGSSGIGFGAHAEFISIRVSARIAPMPSGMSFEEAAPICDGALNALTCLKQADLRTRPRII